MELLYGKPVAEKILAETKRRIGESGIRPGLAVILVGNDRPSHLYVGIKEREAMKAGILFEKKIFPEDVSEEVVISALQSLNSRKDIHGIIVQLPLPEGLDADRIIDTISPEKDTDGFHRETLKRFLSGEKEACPVFPRAIVELLHAAGEALPGKKGLVIANSKLLGEAIAEALRGEGVESRYLLSSEDEQTIRRELADADVVVSALGKGRSLTCDMLRQGAIVIDGGVGYENGKVVGDVDKESVSGKIGFLTPVPGGVGPVTVATLLARVTEAALK
ncbi:MAG: hypothetical protein A2808_01800 [Candidatus Moranbacteria bacterium RIFCSPHIGHO2_01_FULL_55_24]|nr:MAG: hypothetical protein A2808_01800 [Candidatus Moranbacteria bacterium RIFCSPHIGHO2_01_FULL_55_24]